MDSNLEFQRRIAKIALAAAADGDFALAGGAALREHGITTRPTEDIDLFRRFGDRDKFIESVNEVCDALKDNGYEATIEQLAGTGSFARLHVSDATGDSVEIAMGEDYRASPPVLLDVGPVLSRGDIIGAKVSTACMRTYTRDLIDLDYIRQAGQYTDRELYQMAEDTDPGTDPGLFRERIGIITQINQDEFDQYDVTADQRAAIEDRLQGFSESLRQIDAERSLPAPPNIHAAALSEQLCHVANNPTPSRGSDGPNASVQGPSASAPDTGPSL
ncbi:hypothetical protein BJF89_16760 [Corynebacterium sp. CNJ-954]|uniref:nucleotidyl transferase AbiEii/AbiGii toxin family protein n=1 Tax=Corynebacterium sp. CNJ-954 TaxID=1904962 RepID=UPI0009665BC4|nr:nucleotidyl transferase AbiEii/AbiGii toxin family protein [Corynebacterium sp. CNJ-954]OLT54426.1 hypothetical protein BJF89_16760 [Corynebacterium sp. CNJ-954]